MAKQAKTETVVVRFTFKNYKEWRKNSDFLHAIADEIDAIVSVSVK